ncbi:MAG: hypothetical protein HY922_04800 [Elusimicrobia bacterium]|nr:hypothetical protein [Elusimicrobiota bacterium]
MLPIQPFEEEIVRALKRAGGLILSAPTGSGKSTQTPRFILKNRSDFPGRTLALEPRRLAARSLAARVAFETRTRLGEEIGYQVRFESRCGRDTAVVFQTYGVFIQQVLADPFLKGIGAVALDEFHERTLETDLALAWLKALKAERRRDLKLLVMSATLDPAELLRCAPGLEHLDVPGRLFPVEVRHLPPNPREGLAEHALRALRLLHQEGLDGSILIFMPGMREIQRTASALNQFCMEKGLLLQTLHGSMELSEQQKVLDPDPERKRVIVSTNAAETSLTIPGVSMVIDAGLHRIAAYSAARDMNTLYLGRISRRNADQRAGRAGRTAPGRCLRLWPKSEESSMQEALLPEILRLELSALRLKTAFLPLKLDWLTAPKEEAWSAAGRTLLALKAVEEGGRITAKGRDLIRYPLAPRLAAVIHGAQRLGKANFEFACAMAAVMESELGRRKNKTVNLYVLAENLLAGNDEDLGWEASNIFHQLKRLGEGSLGEGDIPEVWLEAFADRLASRQGEGLIFHLADGRKAHLPLEKGRRPPDLILALEIHESAGAGQARQVSVPVYLPCEPEMVQKLFPGECSWTKVSELDEKRLKVVKEERLMFRGLAIASRRAKQEKADRKAAAGLWAEKLASGEIRLSSFDEGVEQLVVRIRLARKYYPDYSFPQMDQDDWRLIYEEVCVGKNSLKEIEQIPLAAHVGRYIGPMLMQFLEKALPLRKKLPSGRTGRFAYFENQPPELSARLGDFLGMSGTLSLCEGRLPVLFDILAPNQRTVQKTHDLGSFWKNAYPAVKKELQRKYPKHPWP